MEPKPSHWDQRNACAFCDQSVVDHYVYRPPYPVDVIERLRSLITFSPAAALDIGCGTGDVARNLVSDMLHVDAVDISLSMIESGKKQPRGNHPNLRWIQSAVQSASLAPPYALITAGESMHWMEWEIVCRRLSKLLTPGGKLAILTRGWGTGLPEEGELYARYSTTRDFQLMDLPSELERRGLFRIDHKQLFTSDWRPTIDEFIASRHSQSQFSHERMSRESVIEFDNSLRELLIRLHDEDKIRMENQRLIHHVRVTVCWGEPLAPSPRA